jgi:hypothetical protein
MNSSEQEPSLAEGENTIFMYNGFSQHPRKGSEPTSYKSGQNELENEFEEHEYMIDRLILDDDNNHKQNQDKP